jgi:hypothetical protein
MIKKDFQFPKIGAVKFIKENETQKDILVIGCSNLQHNIDFKKVQDSLKRNIDFLYFSGSQNSTFLKYLSDNGYLIGYKTIIFYLPYSLLKENTFIDDVAIFHYEKYASYSYTTNLIKNRPILLFYNWNKYYSSIKNNRKVEPFVNYVVDVDSYVDSITKPLTTFRNCNEVFKHASHIVTFPNFEKNDEIFLKKIVNFNQKLFILFTPLPNIEENKPLTGTVKYNLQKSFNDISWLNEPNLMDSSLFFDQWYHLNYCGREIETEKMIKGLTKIVD